jgi:hypothetical protein
MHSGTGRAERLHDSCVKRQGIKPEAKEVSKTKSDRNVDSVLHDNGEVRVREFETEKNKSKHSSKEFVFITKTESGNCTEKLVSFYSMKFPNPKQLFENEYPDLNLMQPELIKHFVQDIAYPQANSLMDKYITQTIDYMKNAKKARLDEKNKKKVKNNNTKIVENKQKEDEQLVSVNTCTLGNSLYIVVHQWETDNYAYYPFKALADTGSTNSLIHISIVNRYNIPYKPMRLGLSTCGGVDDNSIKGIAHMRIKLRTRKGNYVRYCVNFLVSNKLNGLEAIIGNEILYNTDLVRLTMFENIEIFVPGGLEYIRTIKDKDIEQLESESIYTHTQNETCFDKICKDCDNQNGVYLKFHFCMARLQSAAHPQLCSTAATAGQAVSDETATAAAAAALTVTELIDDLYSSSMAVFQVPLVLFVEFSYPALQVQDVSNESGISTAR